MLSEASDAALEAAAAGLGVEAIALRKRLLSRTVHTGRGSNYVIRYSVAAARSCRAKSARTPKSLPGAAR